jgi:PmbA protein
VSLADDLAVLLAARPSFDDAVVEAWRFELSEGAALRVGVRNGAFGGPYESPGVAVAVGGSIELQWSDGTVTLGQLDRQVVAEFSHRLAGWRASAFRDPWVVPVQAPAPLPSVQTADERVAGLAIGDPRALFQLLGTVRGALVGPGLQQVDVSIRVSRGRRWVATSAGVRVDWPETACTLDVSAEALYGEAFAKRRLPDDVELDGILDRVARTAGQLGRPDAIPSFQVPVLIAPPVLESLVARFLGSNLAGEPVVRGESRFAIEDYRTRRAMLRGDLDVLVDTTLPLELAASPCSPEGVPGGRAGLVERGRLLSPTLSRRQAARAGLPPTPVPRGQPRLLLEPGGSVLDVMDALMILDPGLFVHSVMGVHTQNARSGRFSLVAPHAQVVRAGARGGRVPVRLSGDFFATLGETASAFVRFPHQRNPGVLLRCRVRGEVDRET